MNRRVFFIFLACVLPGLSVALDASDFDEVVGWTVVATSTVVDEFEGCEFDKVIQLDNGWNLVCSSYSYTYAYRPEVAIFVREISHEGRKYWMVKALIDDEFFDMQPIAAK